jgi:hypothetical protein
MKSVLTSFEDASSQKKSLADMHAGGHDQPQDGKFDLGPEP